MFVDLLNLLKWRDTHGHEQSFCLVKEVSARWRDIGLLLGINMNQLQALDDKHRGNAKNIWNEVMSYWLTGEKSWNYPVTWEGLYTLLKDIDVPRIAEDLKEAVTGRLELSCQAPESHYHKDL